MTRSATTNELAALLPEHRAMYEAFRAFSYDERGRLVPIALRAWAASSAGAYVVVKGAA